MRSLCLVPKPHEMDVSKSNGDMIKEFRNIMEEGVNYLKNIEDLIDKRIKKLKIVRKSLDQIDNMIEDQFSSIIQGGFSKVNSELSKKLEMIKPKFEKLGITQTLINDIVNQLKSDVPIYSVKDLLFKVKKLEEIDFTQPIIHQKIGVPTSSTQKTVQKDIPLSSRIGSSSTSKIETKIAEPPSEELAPEGDWSDSELEGSKIFNDLIVGWKLKDFEKIGGTKELFMIAWRKLSSYDKQKIRSGTWSKNIMNKVKFLGREKS